MAAIEAAKLAQNFRHLFTFARDFLQFPPCFTRPLLATCAAFVHPLRVDTLNGTVERVTFHNEETGFAILKVMVKGRLEPVTLKGSVASVQPGEGVSASGAWISGIGTSLGSKKRP